LPYPAAAVTFDGLILLDTVVPGTVKEKPVVGGEGGWWLY